MHVNLLPETRDQITALVQTMHLSEADIVGFAVRVLYDEKHPRHGGQAAPTDEEGGRRRRRSTNDSE